MKLIIAIRSRARERISPGSIATSPQVIHKPVANDWHVLYEITTLEDAEIETDPLIRPISHHTRTHYF